MKDVSEFGKNASRSDGLQAQCKPCVKVINQKSYEKNKDVLKVDRAAAAQAIRDRNRQFVLRHLRKHPCVDCSEQDPVVLQFDHLRDKVADISNLISSASLERLQAEMAKCEVVCANCHLRRTAETFGWFRHLNAV